MKLSIVVPVYNSENTVHKLAEEVFLALDGYELELILVNDGSKDNSEKICENLAAKNKRIKFISLRKNCGEHNAVICGLNYCTGDYVAIIDDDLQNPPAEITILLAKAMRDELDVVYARYENKKHSSFRNWGSRMLNAAAFHLLKKPKGLYLSSFKILHKDVVKEIINYTGPFPYIDALILRSTDNIGTATVYHEYRKVGKSNYNFQKLVSLYLNIFINFSFKPLRYITISGFFISVFSFFMSLYILYEKIVLDTITPGWTFLAMLLLFSIGLTFTVIGLLGEYIGKILMSLNNSPQYVIKNTYNLNEVAKEKVIEKKYDRKAIRV
jgi:polyisoprenyl-phosphate glycosyltransferase